MLVFEKETKEELIDPSLASIASPTLKKIRDKVINGERLDFDEGVYLFNLPETSILQKLANYKRFQLAKDIVHYTSTLYIHPTNLCELSCPMCSYYAKPGWKSAWLMTPEQIESKVKEYLEHGISEVHIVGGLWRECNLDYYQDTFSRIKKLNSKLHIKALTPVEYDFLAKLHNISVEEVLTRMKSWGLDSLPGGGAEVLVEKIRKQVAPQKISSDEYLAIHEQAHRLGLSSNITMLFGHVEENEDLVTHMCKVRELQDKTQGFKQFVPLKYHVENNALGKRVARLKPKDVYKIYAVSRLMVDNIPTLRVLWNYVGVKTAQELLNWGCNHFSSTSFEEKIIIMAGGTQEEGKEVRMDHTAMRYVIAQAGRTPQEAYADIS